MYNLNTLRTNEFPISERYLYFNHAAVSPLPARTRRRMQNVVEALADQPSNYFAHDREALMASFAGGIGALINARHAEEIVPVPTTSLALNTVAHAIPWRAGANVVFCDVEFPANAYPWMGLCDRGVDARQVPPDHGGLTVETLRQCVDEKTQVVTVSALQFFTGHRTDVAAIGAFCRERGLLFVVDAIQSIGHIPVDVQAMHIDVLASGGQKSLLASPGCGFLYVRRVVAEQMEPDVICGNSTRDYLDWLEYDLTPADAAQRFAMGTPNLSGIAAVAESVSLLQELGVEAIDAHTTAVAAHARASLMERGLTMITPDDHGPIVTFASPLPGPETDALVAKLEQEHVSISRRDARGGMPCLRLSFHCYNTTEEVDQFLEIFDRLLSEVT